jgi:hypothetical protein
MSHEIREAETRLARRWLAQHQRLIGAFGKQTQRSPVIVNSLPEKLCSRFFQRAVFMRLLLTTALTVTLMGCSFAPQQTAWMSGCTEATTFACSDAASSKASHGEVIAAKKKEVRHQANTDTKTARSGILLKTGASSSSQPDNAITTSSIAVRPRKPLSSMTSLTPQSKRRRQPSPQKLGTRLQSSLW